MKHSSRPESPRPSARIRRAWRGRGAFSLVEVVMALGITGFALVAVMGLVPIGLNTAIDARQDSIYSEVIKSVANTAQQTDFSDLATLDGEQFWFDGEGLPTDEKDDFRMFLATVVMPTSGVASLPVGDGGESQTWDGLKAIQIQIGRQPSGISQPTALRAFTVFVADQGR